MEGGALDGGAAAEQKSLDTDPGKDRSWQAKTMLEAHEALIKADAANLTKFKDVLEYLRQDLQRPE